MPRISTQTVQLFRGYPIPRNESHHYICSYCGVCTKRSRNKWIQHLMDFHEREFEFIVGGLQAVENAIEKISSDDDNEDPNNQLTQNQTVGEKKNTTESIETQLKQLILLKQNGLITPEEFIDYVEKLVEKN